MVNNKNQLIFGTRSDESAIKLIDLHADKVEAKTVVTGASNFGYSADRTKLLVTQGSRISVIDAAPGQKLGGNVSTKGMSLYVSPRDEWEQIFWKLGDWNATFSTIPRCMVWTGKPWAITTQKCSTIVYRAAMSRS